VVKQMTEMLKGTLEGIVLAILSVRPAYGYEITARLREQGLSDIAEGTVYALLVRIEQRGEGPLGEGTAAQGVLAQHSGTRIPRRVLEDLELPRRTA
jgi:Transcriptional regulator PadR-like family